MVMKSKVLLRLLLETMIVVLKMMIVVSLQPSSSSNTMTKINKNDDNGSRNSRGGCSDFVSRRKLIRTSFAITTSMITSSSASSSLVAVSAVSATTIPTNDELYRSRTGLRHRPFVYSESWTGTCLITRSLEDSVTVSDVSNSSSLSWTMAKWPDPILRRPTARVDPKMWQGSSTDRQKLKLAATMLRDTAKFEGAVGLAAQQVGIDANMIYLSSSSDDDGGWVFINARIVNRSPESDMRVWTEECLVLPPTFKATVLRDDWIDVDYDFLYDFRSKSSSNNIFVSEDGKLRRSGSTSVLVSPMRQRFLGEQSRCLQHELDHDRGILITDHVGLDELESDLMRQLENDGHDQRMALAYSRK